MRETWQDIKMGIKGKYSRFGPIAIEMLTTDSDTRLSKNVTVPAGTKLVVLGTTNSLYDFGTSFRGVGRALGSLANYLDDKAQGGENIFLYGITNEHLARVSERYGFATEKIPADFAYKRLLRKSFNKSKMAKRGVKMESAVLCYQTGEEFVARFANRGVVYV